MILKKVRYNTKEQQNAHNAKVVETKFFTNSNG